MTSEKSVPSARPKHGFPESGVPAANVSSVPMRSPLRYPGGKTWLVPHIRKWLEQTNPEILIEPFAGGAIVSMTAVMEGLVDECVMIERDSDVAAFWESAIHHGDALARRVREFNPTRENIQEIERLNPSDRFERGFRALVLNRTRRGGIISADAGYSNRVGLGDGLPPRWYPDTVAGRIAAIGEYTGKIEFVEGDSMETLPGHLESRKARRVAVFVDPPYTGAGGKKAGTRLYRHSNIDHASLFSMLKNLQCNFLMTYDTSPEIVDLVRLHDFAAAAVTMKNGHHSKMRELVITPSPMFA